MFTVYAPPNQCEKACRDPFWQQLTQHYTSRHITAHRKRSPILVEGAAVPVLFGWLACPVSLVLRPGVACTRS